MTAAGGVGPLLLPPSRQQYVEIIGGVVPSLVAYFAGFVSLGGCSCGCGTQCDAPYERWRCPADIGYACTDAFGATLLVGPPERAAPCTQQSAGTQWAFRVFFLAVPAAGYLLAALPAWRMPITRAMHAEIVAEIRKRAKPPGPHEALGAARESPPAAATPRPDAARSPDAARGEGAARPDAAWQQPAGVDPVTGGPYWLPRRGKADLFGVVAMLPEEFGAKLDSPEFQLRCYDHQGSSSQCSSQWMSCGENSAEMVTAPKSSQSWNVKWQVKTSRYLHPGGMSCLMDAFAASPKQRTRLSPIHCGHTCRNP